MLLLNLLTQSHALTLKEIWDSVSTAAKQARIYVSAEIDKVQKRLSDAKLQLAQFKKEVLLLGHTNF